MSHRKPAWTANLYCEGHLDEAIRKVLVPLRRDLTAYEALRACDLWFLRYGRGGEHLKVRLHGPRTAAETARGLMAATADRYLASYEPVEAGEDRARPWIPPMDSEDDSPQAHPDGRLVWTHYRRSHVTFGGKPWLDDGDYIVAMTRCLVASSDATLSLVGETNAETLTHSRRHQTLLNLLLRGLASLPMDPGRYAAYLTYHRNWLLRYTVIMGQSRPEAATNLIARFNDRLAGMGEAEKAVRKLAAPLRRSPANRGGGEGVGEWSAALRDLVAHLVSERGPRGRPDPFTRDPTFPPLFKAFHHAANQLGLGPPDEAHAHHMLLSGVLEGAAPVEDFAFEPPPPPNDAR